MNKGAVESVEAFFKTIPKFQSEGAKAADFNLNRFQEFCDYLGNPQREFDAIHVAGTNGKGSTCRILSSIYREAGYEVGLFTSPHIIEYNERFQINGELISDNEILEFINAHRQKIEEFRLTYFEISTAIAYWWFARKNVDLAIVEVGLGGRLDATNVIVPSVSVITSISLDHTDILGDSMQEIAREKGGIIKMGRPVVIGDLSADAENEIRNIASEENCELYSIRELHPQCLGPGKYSLDIGGREKVFKSKLTAPVQAKNIAIAWQVSRCLKDAYPVTEVEFAKGVADARTGLGRFERLTDSERWYFDGAHNLEAVNALKQSVRTLGNIEDSILVLSMMKDKIRDKVMNQFLEFPNIYYYPLDLERAADYNDIKVWLPQVKPFPSERTKQLLQKEFHSELVIFAGSFYFYVTVRGWVPNVMHH